MNDKVKTQTQEMTRNQLVRANFEAYRDLEWAKNMEPKFRRYDVNAEGMRHFRKEWNSHTEENDWTWWRKRVETQPDQQLKAEIAECLEEIKALQMRQSAHDPIEAVGRTFLKILSGEDTMPSPEPAQTRTRSNER